MAGKLDVKSGSLPALLFQAGPPWTEGAYPYVGRGPALLSVGVKMLIPPMDTLLDATRITCHLFPAAQLT